MSYEAAIPSFGGDEITLTKSFIISLQNASVIGMQAIAKIHHIMGKSQGEIPS
jgi:hypothetical protein